MQHDIKLIFCIPFTNVQFWINSVYCVCNQINVYWVKLLTRYWFGGCWNFHWEIVRLTLTVFWCLAYSLLVVVFQWLLPAYILGFAVSELQANSAG